MDDIFPAISRRALLKSGAALIVGFVFDLGDPAGILAQASVATDGSLKPLDPHDVDSFFAIHADGTLTLYTGKVDIGTGFRIAVAQMAAEELGIPTERITVIDGDTGLCPDQGGTGGSTGLTQGGAQVRQAAATARQALLKLGAEQLHRPIAELTIANGEVQPLVGGHGIGVGSLLKGRRLLLQVDPQAPLRDPSRLSVMGKPLPRPDIPAKATGRHVYVQDFTLPNMLHARVIRPPAVGATLVSVDESSIGAIPGARVVRRESFLAVVARDEWVAVRAAQVLKANWSGGQTLPGSANLDAWTRAQSVDHDQVLTTRGDLGSGLAGASTRLSATYFWPYQSHASLGPSCAVADIQGDGGTVWSSSQGTHGLRANLAKVFGLAPERLRVIFLEGSGSYGTNGGDHAAADAVLLSKTVGQPVRVQWMRQDEHGWDPKGPPQLLALEAGLNRAGRLVAWETQMWLPNATPGARALLAADEAGLTQEHGQGAGLLTQNGDPPYHVDHVRVTVHWVKDSPLQLSNLRAPGKIANVFAVESFVDELAAASKIGPLEFRLAQLSDARALDVLRHVAEAFGWERRPSPNPQARQGNRLVGRGLAYVRYKQAENYIGTAMEVAVDPGSGRIDVRRVVCAHDCGLIVNPDALKNQIEGCIVQTLSRALYEEVTFDHARVTSVDWIGYPILKATESPTIDVRLINRLTEPLLGAGEAATAPVAAALANALFDATGVRMRTAPFTPQRVKAALANRPGTTA